MRPFSRGFTDCTRSMPKSLMMVLRFSASIWPAPTFLPRCVAADNQLHPVPDPTLLLTIIAMYMPYFHCECMSSHNACVPVRRRLPFRRRLYERCRNNQLIGRAPCALFIDSEMAHAYLRIDTGLYFDWTGIPSDTVLRNHLRLRKPDDIQGCPDHRDTYPLHRERPTCFSISSIHAETPMEDTPLEASAMRRSSGQPPFPVPPILSGPCPTGMLPS